MLFVFLVTLFLAPQVWLRPFVGLPVDYAVFTLWLGIAVLRGRWMPRGLQHVDVIFLLFLFWLVATTVVNGLHEGDPSRAAPSSVGYLVAYGRYFLLFQLVIAETGDFRRVDRLGRWILVFAGILVVESIQHKLGSTQLGWAGQSLGWADPAVLAAGGSGRTRWVSIFDGPGVFCVVFTTALPFALRYMDPWQTGLKKVFGAAVTLSLLVAIYFNGSRGGFLATLAVLALYVGVRYRVSVTKLALGIALSVGLFLAAPSQLTTMRDDSRSADHRIDMWAEGIEMAVQNPVFGIGRGNFRNYTSRLIAHNSAVEIMGEMGMVGLFLWAALIYLCGKSVWRTYAASTSLASRSLAVAIAISLAGYMISSMFVTLEYETFYLLLGMCVGAGIASGENITLTGKDVRNIVGIVGCWFVLLKAAVMVYY
jgi:O-antigen ligase